MSGDMADKREHLAALISKDRRTLENAARATQRIESGTERSIEGDTDERHAPFPLTRIQQSYLIGRSGDFVLGNVSTHNYFEIELDRLDVARFSDAWNALIGRHEMMRAVFAEDGTQRILEDVPDYAVAFHDFSGDGAAGEDRLAAIRERMSHQTLPFDRWPLFEVVVARRGDGRFRLHFSIDMLVADAMSTMILIRDLDALYASPGASLPPLTYTFRTYVQALYASEGTEAQARARAYWEDRVDALPPAPELPLATTPENIQQPRFIRREHMIGAERWERSQKRVQAAGMTASALLLTLFAAVLARWAKTSHFCLNLTLLNRPPVHPQIGDVVGDFTSLILLETKFDPGATLRENIRRVQDQLWRDMEHRGFDGVDVLRLLNRRYASQQAVAMPIVFTSALGMSGSRRGEASGEFLSTLTRLGDDASYGIAQSSQVWLDHVVRESAGALGVSWDTLDGLFPDGMLDDMFAAYCDLLEAFADERLPLDRILPSALPPLQAARRLHVNATAAPVPEGLIHEPFLARADEHGDRIAVRYPGGSLSYRALRALAVGIADRLANARAGCETPIAVVMHKGWEQVAAVLGILCHGGAYLPIDAQLPEERIHLLLAQAGVDTILTQPDVGSHLRFPAAATVLTVVPEVAAPCDALPPPPRATPDDIAYVIFTSGSTGIPKGVVIEHRGALNTIVDINRRFGVGPDDRVLCVSSLSFDLSVYDIFGVLAAGGTLVVPEAARDKDPAHWLALVEDEGVTLWNTVPPLLQLLVEQAEHRDRTAVRSLRLALSSGDWMPPALPDRLFALRPEIELVSLGGATEASIWSIAYPVKESMAGRRSVPYGRPLDNQMFRVLDDALQDRPDWATGHLHIGGIGLARGYWGDEVKTAASFFVHPLSGERLYRTGDLGRYLPDGDIEFLGRSDSQVKIRGNRVELGEIEAVLRRAEGIRDAVVLADGDKFGQRRLVAYVVPDIGADAARGKTADDGLLTDPIERAAFKFQCAGLRRFQTPVDAVSLSGALRRGDFVFLRFPETLRLDARIDVAPLPLSRLGAWLAALADIAVEGHALPKRLYPSAGSTHAVQCYLRVGEHAVAGLAPGNYYHDPAQHRLLKVGVHTPGAQGLDVVLIADMRAIAPLYGRYAEKFAAIEAGHAQRLLAGAAAAHGIALADLALDTDCAAAFDIGESHRVLAALRVGPDEVASGGSEIDPAFGVLARQSYRRFEGGPLALDALSALFAALPTTGFTLLLAIHDDHGSAPAGTLYRFERDAAALTPVFALDPSALRLSQGIENQDLHAAAQFTAYLMYEKDEAQAWRAAGQWAQQAMHLGPLHGFGFCPVGNIAMTAWGNLPEALPMGLVYGLLGGRIGREQMRQWPVDVPIAGSDGYQALRRYLAQSLPDYMIPSVFATIDSIPLSTNGKLDRNALPAISGMDAGAPKSFVAPETSTERAIASLWTHVLNRDEIGVHDNFFEAGGDSLSAIRLLSGMRRSFEADGTEMTLKFVFENPTIRQMADHLGTRDQTMRLMKAAEALDRPGVDVVEGEL